MTTITRHAKGITFAVDDVTPRVKKKAERKLYEVLDDVPPEHRRLISCSNYHTSVLEQTDYQPLLSAVYTAFSEHRPLVLSPDTVWITIVQGVAHHMMVHGERLRSRFVQHQGRVELTVRVSGWVLDSPENPWPEAFAGWADQIRQHVGDEVYNTLICDFSTSGPLERAISHVAMMDVFERYFHYTIAGMCGIPTVTLEGTPSDWERLRDKAAALRMFDMNWWLDHLLPICDQFIRASHGVIDLEHWRNICKKREEYGGDIINGWIAKLFPYLRAHYAGPCTQRNPIFTTGEGFQTLVAPSGLSSVPMTWIDESNGNAEPAMIVAGLVGVAQEDDDTTLRPKLGWGVYRLSKQAAMLHRLTRDHDTTAGYRGDYGAAMVPPDLGAFYHHTNGAGLFLHDGESRCTILSVESLNLPPLRRRGEFNPDAPPPRPKPWYPIARMANGDVLYIWLHPRADGVTCRTINGIDWEMYRPICVGDPNPASRVVSHPVVALTYTEFLTKLLEANGACYWLDGAFVSYGEALDIEPGDK